MITGSLTVLFEDPFWIGLFEMIDQQGLRACKVTFGAEPTDKEVMEFIDKNWNSIKRRDVIDFIKDTRISRSPGTYGKANKPRTSWQHVLKLRALFDFLVNEEYVSSNPVPNDDAFKGFIPDEKEEHEIIFMTPQEVKQVEEHIYTVSRQPERDVCIFMLGCRYGIRETALSNINVEDVYVDEDGYDILSVNDKGNQIRKCHLDANSLSLIKKYLEVRGGDTENGPLFTKFGSSCERITPGSINVLVKKFTSILPKKITAHKMRATCITNTYDLTGDIYQAARRAGHINIENTKRYINTKKQDRDFSDSFVTNLY